MLERGDAVFRITTAGQVHLLDLSDIDGVEWRDIKRETGLLPLGAYTAACAHDFEAIAALLWIARRRSEPDLTFNEVLKSVSFATTSSEPVDSDDDGSEGDTDDPPTVSGDS